MIPVFKPYIEKKDIKNINKSLDLGWLGMGKDVMKFENELSKYLQLKKKNRHIVTVNTGHSALHLAVLLLNCKKGDEIITPSFNNVSDLQAITTGNANPVFCDVDPNTLCIDLDKAERLITKKTKAIVVMDYDCFLCDHDKANYISKKYNIKIIHDAAHSFGSHYKGKKIGSFSDICMFSFDPVKPLTCIDGGALVVKTKKERDTLHRLRLIGMGQPAKVMYKNKRAWTYDVKTQGYRYHLANSHAAMGLSQLKKIEIIKKKRVDICKKYNQYLLRNTNIVIPNTNFENVIPFLYYIRVLKGKRSELIKFLKKNGIDTGIHWQPGHTFSYFKKFRRGGLEITNKISKEVLSLPLFPELSVKKVKYISSTINRFYEKK